jgi:AsmA-like C-terminal region
MGVSLYGRTPAPPLEFICPPPSSAAFGCGSIHRMRKALIAIGATLAILGIAASIALHLYTPTLKALIRHRTEAYLAGRFESTVEFSNFTVSGLARHGVTIDNLVLRHYGRTDVPPLIQFQRLTFNVGFWSLFHAPAKISSVQISGLQLHLPPRYPGGPALIHGTDKDLAKQYPVIIGEIHTDDALLVTLPRDPQKTPREFLIHHLMLHDAGFSQPADFHAILTNPIPKGEIDCTGQFGPWDAENPAQTPVNASFTFDHADLGTIRGIKGILSSKGKFGGPLDYLSVEGYTDTPDFALRTSNNPVPLHTDYTAIVDGTNGDVYLKNVTARFMNSTIVARGSILDENKFVKGRTIDLDAYSQGARIEDLLRLTVKSEQPLITGSVRLKTKILIPENDNLDVVDRMKLDGQFGVGDMRFTNPSTEGKVESLSRRAQGNPKNLDVGSDDTDLQGAFKLDNAVISFSDLRFGVTGATVELTGTYGMDSGALDFRGKLIMQAKLSQTTTGMKSFFLKAVDPFFKGKQGGTELPIKITGTKEHPSFGLDLHDHDKSNPKPGKTSATRKDSAAILAGH